VQDLRTNDRTIRQLRLYQSRSGRQRLVAVDGGGSVHFYDLGPAPSAEARVLLRPANKTG
jgi:hypothetical protein